MVLDLDLYSHQIIQQNQEKEQLNQKSLTLFSTHRLEVSGIQFPALLKKTENQNHRKILLHLEKKL